VSGKVQKNFLKKFCSSFTKQDLVNRNKVRNIFIVKNRSQQKAKISPITRTTQLHMLAK